MSEPKTSVAHELLKGLIDDYVPDPILKTKVAPGVGLGPGTQKDQRRMKDARVVYIMKFLYDRKCMDVAHAITIQMLSSETRVPLGSLRSYLFKSKDSLKNKGWIKIMRDKNHDTCYITKSGIEYVESLDP
jgi:hypothetical protein